MQWEKDARGKWSAPFHGDRIWVTNLPDGGWFFIIPTLMMRGHYATAWSSRRGAERALRQLARDINEALGEGGKR